MVGHVFQARLNHLTDGIGKMNPTQVDVQKKSEMVK